jgi:hypothetical protein
MSILFIGSGDWRVLCANRSRKPALSEVEGDLRLFCNELSDSPHK